jgi:transposase
MARLKIQLEPKIKASLKDASVKLTGIKKRAFIAKATQDYFKGSPRQAETYMGWSRKAVSKGLKELETGILCQDNNQAKGRNRSEQKNQQLERDIQTLVDGKSQADPKFQTVFCYARTSARAVRQALIEEKGYTSEELPSRQTIGAMLNRMGYRLKKHKKSNP